MSDKGHVNSYRAGNYRSKSYHRKRRARRMWRQFILSALPFFLVVLGLVLISIGFFRYVEQESILAIFLVKRDAARNYSYQGDDWHSILEPEEEILPSLARHTVQSEPDERLKVPFYYIGEQFATLKIPRVDIEVAVFQGDREREFKRGVGHYTGSFFPGQGGNILLSTHRTTYFRNLEHLSEGDLIHMEASYGNFLYQVEEIFIIDGSDQSIAAPSDEERLTLYTCYPFNYVGNALQRFVVYAGLVQSEVYE